MVKVVTFFLIGMMVLALLGRLRLPEILKGRKNKQINANKCPDCGAYLADKDNCSCKRDRNG